MIGKTISHYKILEKLGEGGMGVVYKARDTKLDREVALKFLPTATISTEEDKVRFEQEAKAAAKLSHANIATVHAIDEVDGQTFIAMEYVDGQTLSDKVKERPLKIKDALKITRQIAEGLHSAHEQGIVHRDIKSANVMITGKGVVKIMDFGLAKVSRASMVTKAGTTMGTISYMSPEQTQGEKVDHRSDIWSLGVVLYEMVSGQLPFKGDYESAIIYSIMNEEPEPLTAVRTGVPMDLEKIVNKLLAKEPGERYQSIIELPIDLKNVSIQEASTSKIGTSAISDTMRREKELTVKVKYSYKTLMTVAVAVIATFLLTWFLKPEPAPPAKSVKRFTLRASEEADMRGLAISPDGSQIAYVASDGDAMQLFLRSMDKTEAVSLTGSQDRSDAPGSPFFSPDGRWVAFHNGNELNRVLTTGGRPLRIAEVSPFWSGASWGQDDTIIIGNWNRGLTQVPATGGTPEAITKLDVAKGELSHIRPHFLPGGKHVLFTVRTGNRGGDRIAILSRDTGEYRILLDELGAAPRYSPSGHVLFFRRSVLMGALFDLSSLTITGSATPVVQQAGGFDVSSEGTLVYSQEARSERKLVWVSRNGKVTPFVETTRNYTYPRISPDGNHFAVLGGSDLYVYDFERVTSTQLARESQNLDPIWAPNGMLSFSSRPSDRWDLYWQPHDGSRAAEALFVDNHDKWPTSWTPDGQSLVFESMSDSTNVDIWVKPLDGQPWPFLVSDRNQMVGSLSPNGGLMAYVSDESGTAEVYIRTFPDPNEGKWKISNGGGKEPVWSRDGRELYYRAGSRMMVMTVADASRFRPTSPRILFEGRFFSNNASNPHYDVSPDGQRFLMIEYLEDKQAAEIQVVLNWFEELNRLVPVEKN